MRTVFSSFFTPTRWRGCLKAWKLRNKLRQKQKDKKRRSRPTTSTAPELERNEHREEDDRGSHSKQNRTGTCDKGKRSEDTPPDWGGSAEPDDDMEGQPQGDDEPNDSMEGQPRGDEEHAEDTQWPWGRHGRPSDRGDSPLHLAVRPNEPAEEPPNQRPRPRQATAAGSEMETRGNRAVCLIPSMSWQYRNTWQDSGGGTESRVLRTSERCKKVHALFSYDVCL